MRNHFTNTLIKKTWNHWDMKETMKIFSNGLLPIEMKLYKNTQFKGEILKILAWQ